MVLVYFGTLGLTRLAIALVTAFISSPTTAMSLQFKLAPNTIGTAFGTQLPTLVGQGLRNSLLTWSRSIGVPRRRLVYVPQQ